MCRLKKRGLCNTSTTQSITWPIVHAMTDTNSKDSNVSLSKTIMAQPHVRSTSYQIADSNRMLNNFMDLNKHINKMITNVTTNVSNPKCSNAVTSNKRFNPIATNIQFSVPTKKKFTLSEAFPTFSYSASMPKIVQTMPKKSSHSHSGIFRNVYLEFI